MERVNRKKRSNRQTNSMYSKRHVDEEEWSLLQELQSLGIETKRISDLNDKQELQNLVDNIKQTMYQEYKTHYREQ